MNADDILHFWFTESTPAQWFAKDDAFDAKIRERYLSCHQAAALGEYWEWRATARGRLAEIIVLDQFSRNLFRGQAQAFAQDAVALVLAQEAVRQGLDGQLTPTERAFLYLPYMHSESRKVQAQSMALFAALGRPDNLRFAQAHQAIVERFDRYPHRNAALGRPSTPEEEAFLREPGSSF
ncbi:MAG: DUF924 domain-containing protein [Acidovorax sp.]|nr:DUF924 domain-containing protein [Acidovorax sp.]